MEIIKILLILPFLFEFHLESEAQPDATVSIKRAETVFVIIVAE